MSPTTLRYGKTVCGVYREGNLVIARELKNNPGTSITNAAESLAKIACIYFNIKMEDLIWMECTEKDGLERVYFDIVGGNFVNPVWV